ncbi:hypothetical protein JX265_001785 [Neoarthrinium moseri]|uniref:HRDC domain-containing protein n=1 Tax=Neoarthrinium moseri TaxID=1658444 RepID=A0A9P9WVT8_9PEZI|nr:hypothetical protein JX265_001785 [Neoarthrinium moseri]
MDSSQDFKSLQEKIQAALVKATRSSNQLAAEDLNFQRRSNPAAAEQLDDASERLLALSTSLLRSATKGTSAKHPDLEDADDVDVHWSKIVDVIDTLLEKADTCLDEYTGLVKRKTAPTEEVGSLPKKTKTFDALDPSMRRANILKPQNAFQVKPDNIDNSPWKPFLTKKPHATLPLDKSLGTFNNEEDSVQYDYHIFLRHLDRPTLSEARVPSSQEESMKRLRRRRRSVRSSMRNLSAVWGADSQFRYKHPYETEILNLQYPVSVYQTAEPIHYQPVESTAATFVDTFEGVLDMLAELKKAKEIAIDTEHHDFRTYTGLLSLMQISTRDKDWIVDTLQPWRHKLEVLNEVFADPNIIKVLHGAYMDIIWLQRDCGLYIVGLFDTFHAAETLGYPGRSLAYLLKRFANFDADKKPIPEEMYYYARSDTHYLLYVYDCMRNELVSQSKQDNPDENYIEHVLERSKATSLRRHEKFIYDAEGGQGIFGWFNMLMKQSSGNFSREQFAVFRAVHKWRDDLARKEDESPAFIMSNPAVFDIARRLPPDPKALHSLIPHISYVVKQRISELFKLVEQAKADGANGPSLSEFFSRNAGTPTLGIGAVAQQVFPDLRKSGGAGETIIDTKDLVSESSLLWGEVPISTRWEADSHVNETAKTMEFALPWASFMENASVSEPLPSVQKPATEPAKKLDQKPSGSSTYDDEFTLKAGTKRKAPEPEPEQEESEDDDESESTPLKSGSKPAPIEGDEISVNSTDEEEEKAKRKAAKKARKERQKAKREAKLAAEAATENDEEEQPFDYSNAESVLKARRGAKPAENGGKGGKGKVFNPYSSLSAEGPKGARRMHGEKPGKTAIFKKL